MIKFYNFKFLLSNKILKNYKFKISKVVLWSRRSLAADCDAGGLF
jgi:hypothetical protein